MAETISPLLYLEKSIENEDISMQDDYEVIKSIYPDDIKEIINNPNEIYFLLKLKHEIEIENSLVLSKADAIVFESSYIETIKNIKKNGKTLDITILESIIKL